MFPVQILHSSQQSSSTTTTRRIKKKKTMFITVYFFVQAAVQQGNHEQRKDFISFGKWTLLQDQIINSRNRRMENQFISSNPWNRKMSSSSSRRRNHDNSRFNHMIENNNIRRNDSDNEGNDHRNNNNNHYHFLSNQFTRRIVKLKQKFQQSNDDVRTKKEWFSHTREGEVISKEKFHNLNHHHHYDDDDDDNNNCKRLDEISTTTTGTIENDNNNNNNNKKKQVETEVSRFITGTNQKIQKMSIDLQSIFPEQLQRMVPLKWKGESQQHKQLFDTTDMSDSSTTTIDNDGKMIIALSQPLVDEDIWDQLDGTEFQKYPSIWNELAKMGEYIAINDQSNEWIDWNQWSSNNEKNHNEHSILQSNDTTIYVWTGKCKKSNVRGTNVPWIKTRSIIPYQPYEMVDLLLDSKKVQSYNQWSLGRKDCWIGTSISTIMKQQQQQQQSNNNDDSTNQDNSSSHTSSRGGGDSEHVQSFPCTKIVKNRVQPPLGSKPMVSTTLLHAQRCKGLTIVQDNDDDTATDTTKNNHNVASWIVVSRAVGGTLFYESPHDDQVGQSEMLLGINLLQPCLDDPTKCILTAVTHVYSSAVPTMLAERIGVKSAIKFVKDMRSLKEEGDTITHTKRTNQKH